MTDYQKQIQIYGSKVDEAIDQRCEAALVKAIEEIKQILASTSFAESDPALYYFLGTGYGELARNKNGSKEYHQQAMFYFRKALELIDTKYPDPNLILRILTNYANELDLVGRRIEALSIYRRALQIKPNFPMALGNYGRALEYYANMVNDPGHHESLHCYAYQSMKKVLEMEDFDFHDAARQVFIKRVEAYEQLPGKDIVSAPIVYKEYDLGNSEEEKYRKWCLHNHLFLNPLNDTLEIESAFCHDPLTITSLTTSIEYTDAVNGSGAEPPRWFAMLNQLKEEYVYARFLCYEGTERRQEPHYADKEVQLSLASFDYTNYSFRIEQLKAAFRFLYSLFDKISFFVNDFWKLGLGELRADAKSIYRSPNYPQDNVALTALYWLLCEFREKYADAENESEKDLVTLRNALEHKFVKIHEYNWERKLALESDSFYHVSEKDFQDYTLRLLHLSREALMYLVFAIGIHERKEHSEKTVQMPISNFPDEWKL